MWITGVKARVIRFSGGGEKKKKHEEAVNVEDVLTNYLGENYKKIVQRLFRVGESLRGEIQTEKDNFKTS